MAASKSIHKGGKGASKTPETRLARWERQERRLLENIANVKANNTMQDTAWVVGQTRHFERLLENHRANKPKS